MIMCHMIADTPAELHDMAEKIGMLRIWYQSPERCSFPHYDLSLTRRADAVRLGAVEISRTQMGRRIRDYRRKLIDEGHTWKSMGWLK
jgi:hypothetical protein